MSIVVNDKHIDAIFISQLSDEYATIIEARVRSATLVIASMYFDLKRSIDQDFKKMQAVTAHAKGTGIVFAIDSNARSTTWHDVLTNKRGKKMEEFLISNQLHIANIESSYTTFQTCRGASNIDLTILNNTAIKYLQD
jgi:hypothetical protein